MQELGRVSHRAREAVDLGDDVAGEQIPRASGRLGVRPVVYEAQHRAEPAGHVLEVTDRLHEFVGRTDDGGSTTLGAATGGLVDELPRIVDLRGARAAEDVDVVVVVPVVEAEHGFLFRLFLRFREVPAHQHAPVLAIDRLSVLLGRFLGERPLRRQRLKTLGRCRGDGEGADAVLAGELHA